MPRPRSESPGLPHRLGAAVGERPPTPPSRRSPWRIVVSTVVTVVWLLVVFVGIFPKVADYSEAWTSIQQMLSLIHI